MYMCGSWRTTLGSQFSPSTMGVPEIELRSPGLAVSIFAQKGISLVLIIIFYNLILSLEFYCCYMQLPNTLSNFLICNIIHLKAMPLTPLGKAFESDISMKLGCCFLISSALRRDQWAGQQWHTAVVTALRSLRRPFLLSLSPASAVSPSHSPGVGDEEEINVYDTQWEIMYTMYTIPSGR